MSWFDDLVDFGSSAFDWATGSSNSAALARAAGLAFLLNELNSSTNPENETKPADQAKTKWSREQIDPSTDNFIPVVYGKAFIGGLVTDAWLEDDNQTMWYCITICEKTGTLMSTKQDSVISFLNMYWNDNEIIFYNDGYTAAKIVDQDGNESTNIDQLVQVTFYNNGSNSPTNMDGYPTLNVPAYALFPNWTPQHTMDNLVFALVKVKYSAEKNVTGLGSIKFHISNTLKQPGDVMYDYMLNTRYGAGINSEEIYSI